MLPKFGKGKPVVGLDIGHHSVKMIQLEPVASGWRVVRVNQIATPQNSLRDGAIQEDEILAEALRQLVRSSKTTVSNCHISVSGGSVVVRNVRVPKMSEAMLRKSIRFEAGRYIPNSIEESYIDFEITGETQDDQMDVMMVAAPKELVDSRIRACQLAGIEVESVDLEPFAAYRSLVQANYGIDITQDTMAMVDIGHSTTKVAVIQKGQFAMIRSIPHGGLTLTNALQQYFKLSYQDAEEGKTQLDVRGLLDDMPSENAPLRVIQPHLDDLVREMRRSINYFTAQQAETGQTGQISWMILSGGGAKLSGAAEYLGSRLGIRVYTSGVFDNPRFAYVGDAYYGQGSELSVASGLAMRSFSKAA